MRKLILSLLAATTIHAAIIRGTVVEHSSGKPLSRAVVALAPLPGTEGSPQSVRTNTWGSFEFPALPAGAYLLTATRRGFPPVQYGQKNWRAAGTPIVIEQEQSTFLNVRMPRYGGITGTVVDENDVGLPEHEVVAYRNGRPPRLAGRGQADDRGIYRIPGLDPGRYLVRTVAREYEEGGYLPTFYRETARVEEASTLDVDFDRDTPDAKVRPFPGRLMTVDGVVYCTLFPPPSPGGTITITLVSDMGRDTITTTVTPPDPCIVPFSFPNKPPGQYEIWATGPGSNRGPEGSFTAFNLERDHPAMRINLVPQASVFFSFRGPLSPADLSHVRVQFRRVDLAGESPAENLRIANGRTQFVQGRWQVQVVPNSAYVATDFRGPRGERPEGGRADGWNEFTIVGSGSIFYTLSNKPAGLRGTVTTGAHDPVGGAPVYLEPWDPSTRKRLGDPRVVRADMRGQYRIDGLAPGSYRLASTFEYNSPDAAEFDSMLPRTIVIEEGREQQQDLDLYIIR